MVTKNLSGSRIFWKVKIPTGSSFWLQWEHSHQDTCQKVTFAAWKRWMLERGSIYNILLYNFGTFDLLTPKRQKMWDSEPRAGKSSKKWVKSSEMSHISKWKDIQWVSWVLEVTLWYYCKAEAVNITINFTILLAAILKHEKHAHLVAAASCCRLRECNQTAKGFHWIWLAFFQYLTWKQTLELQNVFGSLNFWESMRNQLPTPESVR